ncbi:hypothetical protein MMC34_002848 [Xylographa carneopallida]|nr:hypothetical protein [Xylographa carneopallida]
MTYKIHTLLRRERWHDLEDDDWKTIEPVLRLTSAFLDFEASFVCFYSLINSDRIFWRRRQYENVYPRIEEVNPYKVPDQSIEDVRMEYDAVLDAIAEQLELSFSNSKSAEGHTRYQKNRRVHFTTKKLGAVVGQGSNVVLREAIFLKRLRRL